MDVIPAYENINIRPIGLQYPKSESVIKIHVVGDEGVGKTAFMKRATLGHYDPYLKSKTSTDFMQREIHADTEKVILQLWENNPPQTIHSIVVMYDVTSRDSFEHAVRHLAQIRHQQGAVFPVLLLGNKVDVVERCVGCCEGEVVALQFGSLFEEVSCVQGTNVAQVVREFLQSMMTLHLPDI